MRLCRAQMTSSQYWLIELPSQTARRRALSNIKSRLCARQCPIETYACRKDNKILLTWKSAATRCSVFAFLKGHLSAEIYKRSVFPVNETSARPGRHLRLDTISRRDLGNLPGPEIRWAKSACLLKNANFDIFDRDSLRALYTVPGSDVNWTDLMDTTETCLIIARELRAELKHLLAPASECDNLLAEFKTLLQDLIYLYCYNGLYCYLVFYVFSNLLA